MSYNLYKMLHEVTQKIFVIIYFQILRLFIGDTVKEVKVDGVSLTLSHPDSTKVEWIGQQDMMERLLACWFVVSANDTPLCPRLVGKPGVGKTTLAIAAAQFIKKPVYIYQCTMDTRPEDLLVVPVLADSGKISYHASPVVTAMITGGVCILDEGNRMSEKSWASLAPLLDHRRYVESILAGIKIDAHPDFRCCVTMNDDASTYELPDYIMSRLQPTIEIAFPPKEEELQILKYNIPYSDEELLEKTVNFLQRSHNLSMNFSTRDGIHILRYTLKRLKYNENLSKEKTWNESVKHILGFEPDELESLSIKKKENDFQQKFSDFAEFFIDPELFGQNPPEYEDDFYDDEEDIL